MREREPVCDHLWDGISCRGVLIWKIVGKNVCEKGTCLTIQDVRIKNMSIKIKNKRSL